jgi:hypothetical protein
MHWAAASSLNLLLLLLLLAPPPGCSSSSSSSSSSAAGADGPPPPPPPGTEFLVYSAKEGQIAGVRQALAEGVPPDTMNKNGWNALHEAAQHGHTEILRVLIAAGADVNIQYRKAWSPLAFAADYANDNEGGLEAVIALVDAGADPMLKDLNGYDATMRADEGTPHHAVIKSAVGGWWAEKRKGVSKGEL